MDDNFFSIEKRKLPHWRETDSTFFITFSITQSQPDLSQEERDFLQTILTDHHSQRYHLWSWVVMNDHVHAVLTPYPDWQLAQITHTWKSFSANQLQRKFGRKGQVWLHESHDRIIRNESELYQKCEYIMNNPAKRWPDEKDYKWCGFNWK